MLDIFVLEEDYFQQARLEDAIHKSKQIYILRIGKVDLYDKPDQLLERITERGSHLLFFLDIGSDSDVEGGILILLMRICLIMNMKIGLFLILD